MSPSGTDPATAYRPPKPGTSVGQVFAFVAGFVALAAVGAAIGWAVTKSPTTTTVASTTSASPTVSVSSPPSSPSATPTVTVTGDSLPDFNALGITFTDARENLRNLGIGVQLYFNDQGSGATVDHTVPAAGSVVKRGMTVKMYVTGPAPLLIVPDVTKQSCSQGGKNLAAAGLIPSYPDGNYGLVAFTDPAANDSQTHWNDPIKIHCNADGSVTPPGGGPSTGPTTGGGSPSASASP